MNGGEHTRWRDDLAAYTLGSLEPDEATELERHLEVCEACRSELRWLGPAIELLAESTPQLEPAPELRERLMQEVRADAAREPEPAAVEPSRQPRPLGARLQAFVLRPAIALTAVALVAVAIGGYALGGRNDGGGDETIRVEVPQGPEAALTREGDSGTLELTGLRQLPRSKAYQAWVQTGTRVEPSEVFDARPNGTASAAIPGHLDSADAVLVTVEPRAGSNQPTTAPIVDLSLD